MRDAPLNSGIDPHEWRNKAEEIFPRVPFVTEWFDGTQAPVRVGWYERHFSDWKLTASMFHYWDGTYWRAGPKYAPHWRQVGDYPAWRGITQDQARLHHEAALQALADEGQAMGLYDIPQSGEKK
jgi:hypothetical protein